VDIYPIGFIRKDYFYGEEEFRKFLSLDLAFRFFIQGISGRK